jgi:hypothetical protein
MPLHLLSFQKKTKQKELFYLKKGNFYIFSTLIGELLFAYL